MPALNPREEIQAAIQAVIGIDPGPIEDAENPITLGLLDSMGTMMFVFHLEKSIGKKLYKDNEMIVENFVIKDIVRRIEDA